MGDLIQPRVLKGFRDVLPDQEAARRKILETIEEVCTTFGFVPIDTPALEYSEVLLGKGGGETDKQVYQFSDHGGRDVSLRFDLTVPFARYMAAHSRELYLPFKRYHFGKVYRGENTQKGRYREFMQCDFDCVGVDSPAADMEILLMMHRAFTQLGIRGVEIRLSHRGIFNRFLDHLGVRENSVEILRSVDKLKKIGREKTLDLLRSLVSAEQAESILSFITPRDSNAETLAAMEDLAGGPGEDSGRVSTILSWADSLGLGSSFILDPSITRGLDYYTGIVYETFLQEIPEIGSVCSGGRYNNLAGLYTKEQLPGVGSSIGLDRLVAALEELGRLKDQSSAADVIVFCMDDSLMAQYLGVAQAFRNAGFRAEVYPENRKLGPQFSYAEKKHIPLGIILGEEEHSRGTLQLRDLRQRQSFPGLSLEEALARATELLP